MKNVKHIIVMFFVTLILLFKVAGLHALTHDADDADAQHCEVCHITTVGNLIPFLETQPTLVPEAENYFPDKKLNIKSQCVVFNNKHLSSYLYTRPPPQVS